MLTTTTPWLKQKLKMKQFFELEDPALVGGVDVQALVEGLAVVVATALCRVLAAGVVDDAPEIAAYGFDESLTNFEGMGPKLLPLTMKPDPEGGEPIVGRIWEGAERLGEGFKWMQRSEITAGFVAAGLEFIDKAQLAEGVKVFEDLIAHLQTV